LDWLIPAPVEITTFGEIVKNFTALVISARTEMLISNEIAQFDSQ
jgi:hypothetical protein